MDLLLSYLSFFLIIILGLSSSFKGVWGATFTFINNCESTVWPGILSNTNSPPLGSTGFELQKGVSRSFLAPTGWSGRFWARTGCKFDGSGQGTCSTADCGSGQMECNGAGAAPPATLAEFTLGTGGSQDFYDVSLVDGYNLPIVVEGTGGIGTCETTGCVTDLNRQCPSELRVAGGDACKSACEAFGREDYCCSGAYGTPNTCTPSIYSEMFKNACPRSYSYAYDDATSTFTCSGADYTVTFCPSYANSQKSSRETSTTTPVVTGSTDTSNSGSGSGTESGYGSGSESAYGSGSGTQSGYGYGSSTSESSSETGSGSGGAMLADASWLAGLAIGDSTKPISYSVIQTMFLAVTASIVIIIFSL